MDNIAKKAIAVIIMFNILAPALAQDDLPDPGILPNSPIYGLKRGWERALDVITFDPESKSRLHQTYALTRLAEADALADIGETDQLEDVIEDYEEEMDLAEDYAEEVEEPCVPVTCEEGDEECTPVACEESKGIGQQVSTLIKLVNDTRMKHLIVLELVAQKVPEHAAERIRRNINRTLERKFSNETVREKFRKNLMDKEQLKAMKKRGPKLDDGQEKPGKGPKTTETGAAGQGKGPKPKDETNKGKPDKGSSGSSKGKGGRSGGNKGGSGGGKGKK